MNDEREEAVEACVYCGSTEALTDDHIPPKTLFPKPRPSNLITVRSCLLCNQGASKDDEYFRLMLSLRHDTGDDPGVKRLMPSIFRSLQRPEQRGFREALFGSIRLIDVVSRGGVYLGSADGYDVNLARLDRVAARVSAGLFFHEFGRRIPPSYEVTAYSADGLSKVDKEAQAQLLSIFERATCKNPHIVGDGVFAYWYERVLGEDTMSVWVLSFYRKVHFLCMVTPKESA